MHVQQNNKSWMCILQCRWRQQISPKRPYIYIGLHGEKLRDNILSHRCGNLYSHRVCIGPRLDSCQHCALCSEMLTFSGAFANLRKVNISVMEQLSSHWTDFHEL